MKKQILAAACLLIAGASIGIWEDKEVQTGYWGT